MNMPQGYHPYQYQPQQQRDEDSVGSWIGTFLLMMIPLVNIIIIIVMACGGMGTRAKQNFARAYLIIMVIVLLIGVTVVIIGSAAGWLSTDVLNLYSSNY